MAEFFRLGLLAGVIEPSAITYWAESIVAADPSPHIAFIELCVADSQPASTLQTLLDAVPGAPTPELAVRMLLGHSAYMLSVNAIAPEQLIVRLYRIAHLEEIPDSIHSRLSWFEDRLSLARDGVYGTIGEVTDEIAAFLEEFVGYAPHRRILGFVASRTGG